MNVKNSFYALKNNLLYTSTILVTRVQILKLNLTSTLFQFGFSTKNDPCTETSLLDELIITAWPEYDDSTIFLYHDDHKEDTL